MEYALIDLDGINLGKIIGEPGKLLIKRGCQFFKGDLLFV